VKTGNIVLPLYDNNGASLAEAHAGLQGALVDTFGGFTELACKGAWRDDSGKIQTEPGTFYMFSGDASAALVRELALHYGRLADQVAMYWAWDGVPYVENVAEGLAR